jgi:protein-S-isoprenylcysteine O-methyltransferase Ste14
MKNPKTKMWLQFVATFIPIALALFLSAGTIDYWQAWVYFVVGILTSVPLVLYIAKDPILLESRSKIGPTVEQRPFQKFIVWCLMIPVITMFILPGLDHRFGWSSVPLWLSIFGDILILFSMWMVYRVFRANSFGSATVEVIKEQKVISTGPYAIVRNPMYTGASMYFIGMALALGSFWALIPAVLIMLGFVVRLFDEEKLLARDLVGYTEYQKKVTYHLVPFVW